MKKIFLAFLLMLGCIMPSVTHVYADTTDNTTTIKTYENHYTLNNGKEYCEQIETNLQNNELKIKQSILDNGANTKNTSNKLIVNNEDAKDYLNTLRNKMNIKSVVDDLKINFSFLDFNNYFDSTIDNFFKRQDEKLKLIMENQKNGNQNNTQSTPQNNEKSSNLVTKKSEEISKNNPKYNIINSKDINNDISIENVKDYKDFKNNVLSKI